MTTLNKLSATQLTNRIKGFNNALSVTALTEVAANLCWQVANGNVANVSKLRAVETELLHPKAARIVKEIKAYVRKNAPGAQWLVKDKKYAFNNDKQVAYMAELGAVDCDFDAFVALLPTVFEEKTTPPAKFTGTNFKTKCDKLALATDEQLADELKAAKAYVAALVAQVSKKI